MTPKVKTKLSMFQKHRLIVSLAFILLSLNSLISQNVLRRPSVYVSQDSRGLPLAAVLTDDLWFVVSDRNDNQLFANQNRSTVLRTLPFNEVLYVLQTASDGNALEVAPARDIGVELFSARGEPVNPNRINALKGWIAKDHVVAFLECQRQGCAGSIIKDRWNRKGFIGGSGHYPSPPRFSENPDIQRAAIGIISPQASIFFVFKETENAYLLGLSDRLSKANAYNLQGWIQKDQFTIWPTNMAYEPNWDAAAREEFQRMMVRPYFYFSDEPGDSRPNNYLTANQMTGRIRDTIENNGRRLHPYLDRLYLLDNTDTDLKRIGKFSDPKFINRSGAVRAIPDHEYAEIKGIVAAAVKDFSTINIVFAVDGTNGVQPYWQAIPAGISSAIREISSNASELRFNFRFSILLYGDGPYTNSSYTFSGSTSDLNRLSAFINAQRNFAPIGVDGRGLFVGLNSLFANNFNERIFAPGNANYIFVMGDKGNRSGDMRPDWDIPIDTVINNLSMNYFNVIGIQTRNPIPANPAFSAFKEQMEKIITQITWTKFPDQSGHQNLFQDSANEIRINPEISGLGNSGIQWCQPGQTREVVSVTNKIQSTLINISADVWKKELANLYIRIYRDPRYRYSLTYSLSEFKDIFCKIMDLNGSTLQQDLGKGYLRTRLPSLVNPLFHEVILLSENDLQTIKHSMSRLVLPDLGPIMSEANLRQALYNNWILVLVDVLRLYGKTPQDQRIMDTLSLGDLSMILSGTTAPSQFNNYKLRDIVDLNRMCSMDFYSYLSSFMITKYCLEILCSNRRPLPVFLPNFFNEYRRILTIFIVNSFGLPNITPQQLNRVLVELPRRLNNSFFNLDDIRFTSPINPEFHPKGYRWVDCRIFPNEETYEKLLKEIGDILQISRPINQNSLNFQPGQTPDYIPAEALHF